MEDTGEKPLPQFYAVLERAVTSTWRPAHMDRYMVHTVPVLSMVRRINALCLVVVIDGLDKTYFPYPK